MVSLRGPVCIESPVAWGLQISPNGAIAKSGARDIVYGSGAPKGSARANALPFGAPLN